MTFGMDLDKMTIPEVEALLRLLAEWERRELMLLMLERREAEREGGCIDYKPRPPCRGFCLKRVGTNSNSSPSE